MTQILTFNASTKGAGADGGVAGIGRAPRGLEAVWADSGDIVDGARAMKRLFAAITLGTALIAAPALACTPPEDHADRWRDYEDMGLREATFMFRGVVEGFVPVGDDPDDMAFADLDIRRTETILGEHLPDRLEIRSDEFYYAACARGNLHAAVNFQGLEHRWPRVSNGVGVIVIGAGGWGPAMMFILVEGAPRTDEIVRRFEDLHRQGHVWVSGGEDAAD